MQPVEQRVTGQFPALYVTLVSVLIGLVFADLVAEARNRLILWPLTLETAFTWAQLMGTVSSAIAAWVVYSHIGIARRSVASMSDTLVAFLTPVPMLLMTGLTGRPETWPWFYGGGIYLLFAIASAFWQNHLALRDASLAPFRRLTRPTGYLVILYTGAPSFLVLGWLDQNGLLPPLVKLSAAASASPLALICCYMFVHDWRRAVAETSAPENTRQPDPAAPRLPTTDPS
jgi:hypothetical protein